MDRRCNAPLSSAGGSRTDLELVQAWKLGDGLAAKELVARHDHALRRYYQQQLGYDRYEDELQRTWLAILRALARFEGRSTLRTYLYGIAGNCIREARRGDRRRRLEGPPDGSLRDPRLDPEMAISGRQQRQRLAVAMEQLPAPSRRLLELYYWEQRTAREIAEMLGVPENTARSRIRTAKHQIRRTMSAPPS